MSSFTISFLLILLGELYCRICIFIFLFSSSSEEFRTLIDTPDKWKRHTVLSSDSGYSTTDSVDKCGWSPQEVCSVAHTWFYFCFLCVLFSFISSIVLSIKHYTQVLLSTALYSQQVCKWVEGAAWLSG